LNTWIHRNSVDPCLSIETLKEKWLAASQLFGEIRESVLTKNSFTNVNSEETSFADWRTWLESSQMHTGPILSNVHKDSYIVRENATNLWGETTMLTSITYESLLRDFEANGVFPNTSAVSFPSRFCISICLYLSLCELCSKEFWQLVVYETE